MYCGPTRLPISYGTALGPDQLNATVPALTNGASGIYTYSPPNGTALNTGTNTLSVIFIPDDTIDFGDATATTNVSLVVTPAVLTVTAFNASRAFGQANPAFTGSIAGLQNGDNITAFFSCGATASSPAGEYAIVPTLVDPDDLETNYVVTPVPGTLTVIPVVTIPPVIQSAAQFGNSFTFTWSAVPNQSYQIQTATDLNQINWITLPGDIMANGNTATVSEPISNSGQQFYRVVLAP